MDKILTFAIKDILRNVMIKGNRIHNDLPII